MARRIATSASANCPRSSRAVANVVNGTDDRADPCGGEQGNDELGTVRVEQTDVGALAGTQRDQAASQQRGTAFGLGVTQPLGVTDQQRVRRPATGAR